MHTALFTELAYVKHTTLESDALTTLTTPNVTQSAVITDVADQELMIVMTALSMHTRTITDVVSVTTSGTVMIVAHGSDHVTTSVSTAVPAQLPQTVIAV